MVSSFRYLILSAILWLMSAVVTSCGYHLSDASDLIRRRVTIQVPYIQGDVEGRLTSELIRQLAAAGFCYTSSSSDRILIAQLQWCREDYIGYQYERAAAQTQQQADANPSGQPIRRLLPNERRSFANLEFSLTDCQKRNCLLGPLRVFACIDYDFDPLNTDNRVTVFSLGQLTSIDEAHDVSVDLLYRELAKKVVDILVSVCL